MAAYANGKEAALTAAQAAPYQQAAALTAEKTGGTPDDRARVYVLLQTDDDLPYYGLHYYMRPCAQVNATGWHLAADRLEEAYNTWCVPPDAWAQTLADEYAYVYVYQADDELRQQYGALFEGDIADHTLWRVVQRDGAVRLRAL